MENLCGLCALAISAPPDLPTWLAGCAALIRPTAQETFLCDLGVLCGELPFGLTGFALLTPATMNTWA